MNPIFCGLRLFTKTLKIMKLVTKNKKQEIIKEVIFQINKPYKIWDVIQNIVIDKNTNSIERTLEYIHDNQSIKLIDYDNLPNSTNELNIKIKTIYNNPLFILFLQNKKIMNKFINDTKSDEEPIYKPNQEQLLEYLNIEREEINDVFENEVDNNTIKHILSTHT